MLCLGYGLGSGYCSGFSFGSICSGLGHCLDLGSCAGLGYGLGLYPSFGLGLGSGHVINV